MDFKTAQEFLKLKEIADKRATEIYHKLKDAGVFDVSWFMGLDTIEYDDDKIWYTCGGSCRNEYSSEVHECPIEYLWMTDEEIQTKIDEWLDDKRKAEKAAEDRQRKAQEERDRKEYERLKEKFGK